MVANRVSVSNIFSARKNNWHTHLRHVKIILTIELIVINFNREGARWHTAQEPEALKRQV